MIKSLVLAAFKMISRFFVNQIPNEDPIKPVVQRQVENLQEIAGIFTDDDKNNNAQLRNFWISNRKEIALDGISVVIQYDDKFIKDPAKEKQLDDFLRIVAETIESFEN